jgi:hypothetical protein
MKEKDVGYTRPRTIVAEKPNGKFQSTCVLSSAFHFFWLLIGFSASAQIQPAWVAKYNNGIANGTNQAVQMALDSVGNIYVTGFSQNTNGNLGYVTLKYAPSGTLVWAARLDSTNFPSAQPAAMALDSNDNVIVTGSAGTVKYGSNGTQLWTAPYAGADLAADTNGDAYVVGFSNNFATVKLDSFGSNLWMTTYTDVGPTVSQVVAVDSNGNVFVSGSDGRFETDGQTTGYAVTTIKYDADGQKLWISTGQEFHVPPTVMKGAGFDSHENFILNYISYSGPFDLIDYANTNGNVLWGAFANGIYGVSYAMALDSLDNILLSGSLSLLGLNDSSDSYGTIKLSTNGLCLWTNFYPPFFEGPTGAALAIAVDHANNAYTTGYVSEPNAADNHMVTNLVTIKYDNNGNQVWLQQYAPPGNGGTVAVGNAIAVDNSGNVYVTGYESTEAGGTEIVTIKYSPTVLQPLVSGAVLLQWQGSPGESFKIEASTNLQTWQTIGAVTADTNGVAQFNDTNAPNFGSRFYLGAPQ